MDSSSSPSPNEQTEQSLEFQMDFWVKMAYFGMILRSNCFVLKVNVFLVLMWPAIDSIPIKKAE